MGIVNRALFNYLGTMGRKVDKEFRTAGEMVAGFSLDSLAPSDSLFDMEKLLWLNKEHLKTMDLPALLALLSLPDAYGEKVRLLRENAQTLVQLKGLLGIFEHVEVEEEGVAFLSEVEGIDRLLPYLREAVVKESLDMEQAVHDSKEMTGLDRKSSFLSLRIALTGRKSGPPLKEVFRLMSKDSILKRIEWLEMRLQERRSI
jgi:glutamyl/glutaminyl-tRNA synthetase